MTQDRDFRDDRQHLLELLDSEADIRLIAIVGLGYLEKHIETLIVGKMPGLNAKLRQSLFSRLLQNASARFEIAEALGVTDRNSARELAILNRIRNQFAHSLTAVECNDGKVAELIDQLGGFFTARKTDKLKDWYFGLSRPDRLKVSIKAMANTLYEILNRRDS